MSVTTLEFSPLTTAISAEGGVLDLIVRIQACDAPAQFQAATQPPKHLALVVDRSGSMAGRPLAEALHCVEHIAARLTPQDQLAVLTYDHQVSTVQPLAPVNLPALKAALTMVTEGGSTDLFSGWRMGALALADAPANAISRVVLLSDGCANVGLTEPEDILPHVGRCADQGIATTTVGLGSRFNEDLMIAMARTGRGQQYYGQRATDLYDNFDEELQLLQALCLRNLTLELVPAEGVVLQPLGLVDQLANGRFQLPDLPWGAQAWLAVRLHYTPGTPDTHRALLAATLNATALDGTPVAQHTPPFQLPTVAPQAWAQLPADASVATRLDEAHFAHDSQQLAQLLSQGHTAQAQTHLAQMQQRYGHHPWLAAKLARLAELAQQDRDFYRKEAQFSSRRTGQRLSAREDTAYTDDETNNTNVPAFLRKKVEEGQGRRETP